MGVPILGTSLIYGYNMSVIQNTQRPESTLKKKSNSICYHAIRESVAMLESLTRHVPSVDNPAKICTKVVPGGAKRKILLGRCYIIYTSSNVLVKCIQQYKSMNGHL